MKLKRIAFWLLLVMFISVTAWWSFYFPYDRERLYRAIPANAFLVSEHSKLAERWKAMATSPLTLCLLTTAGFKPEEVRSVVKDPGLLTTLQNFAAKNTVIAYVPSLGGSGEPAWVFSSWVGVSGQLYRWSSAKVLAESNLKKVRLNGGREIWTLIKKQNPSDPDLSLAVVEGVLLGCFSHDSLAVRHLVNRVESGAALQPDLIVWLNDPTSTAASGALLDNGWVRWYEPKGNDVRLRRFRYALTSHRNMHTEGWVRGDMDLLIPGPAGRHDETNATRRSVSYKLKGSPGLDRLPRVIGTMPDVFVMAPYALVEPVLSGGPYVARGVRLVSRTLKAQVEPDSGIFLAMFGGDLCGRILGLKVPTVIGGVSVLNATNCMTSVSNTIDMLNSLYRLNVIPRKEDFEGLSVIAAESTRQGVYGSIAATDKPAAMVKDSWLTLSSNLGALTNVIAGANAAGAELSSVPWVKGLASLKGQDGSNCAGYGWINLESAGTAIKHAIAVYSLVLMAQNSEGSGETRRNLSTIETWVNVLKPVKTAEFRLFFEEPQFEFRFSLGK